MPNETRPTPHRLRIAGTRDHGMQPVCDQHGRLVSWEHDLSVLAADGEGKLRLLRKGYRVSVGWWQYGRRYWLMFKEYPVEIFENGIDAAPSP